jgi:NADPH:quinone reductase-like Zn-dependent oxidoreductase
MRPRMKAVICQRYGPPDVLQLRDVEKPTPKDDELLRRVHAATVMAGDCELRGPKVSFLWKFLLRIGFGFMAPRRRILGQDLAGEVESVGKGPETWSSTWGLMTEPSEPTSPFR